MQQHLAFEDDVEGVSLCTLTNYRVFVLVLDLEENHDMVIREFIILLLILNNLLLESVKCSRKHQA